MSNMNAETLSKRLRELAVKQIGAHRQLLVCVSQALDAADWIGLPVESQRDDLLAMATGLLESYTDDPAPDDQSATQGVPA